MIIADTINDMVNICIDLHTKGMAYRAIYINNQWRITLEGEHD
jgi:hypothetical protein